MTACRPVLFYVLLQVLWALTIAWLAVFKIAEFENGAASYAKHFTNWSWTLQLFFYLATVPLLFSVATVRVCNVRWAGWITACLFFPLNAIVWFVPVAVFTLLLVDPEFITDLFETNHSISGFAKLVIS